MAVIFLIGPPAVGKMTVGLELERLLGFRLFHNHVAIEMVAPYFSYGTSEGRRLVKNVRAAFFDAFAANPTGAYIFTYVWAFGVPGEREYVDGIAETFAKGGHDLFWVELEARVEERLKRNRTALRLEHKPTKRDLDWSEKNLLETDAKYRLNSEDGEIGQTNYLRIDNTDLSPLETAELICRRFVLVEPGA
ncbi:MAG: AAA family ATPase [Pseudomonadota bacterium]